MKKLSHEDFISRLHKINPTLKVITKYTGSFNKITVEDINGIQYNSVPSSLLQGQIPIIKSAIDKNKCFEFNSRLIHFDIYDYSLVEYTKNYNKVIIICPIHGEFKQTPTDHLKGCGCKKCFIDNWSILKNDFLSLANKKHKDKYCYDRINYKDYHSHVKIKCNECNLYFSQVPENHLIRTHNCPTCKSKLNPGFLRSSWIQSCNLALNSNPIVYVIRCYNDSEEFIKIGITRRAISNRFPSHLMPYSYEVIKEIKGSPDFVWDKEKELHRKFEKYKYLPLIHFKGETECFNLEVLNLFID